MRFFEKISFKQFKEDIIDDKELYNNLKLPKRSTKKSAGYDFYSPIDLVLKPNDIAKIPTGIKARMNDDEVLLVYIRSNMGFKYNVRMCNQTGIIDSDYYNNPSNEGHIFIKIQNEGTDDFMIKKDDRICQGIFIKYLTVDNEEKIDNERTGGFGSTDDNKTNT